MIAENLEPELKQKFNELEIEINFPEFDYHKLLKGIDSIEEFLTKEKAFWQGIKNSGQIINSYVPHYTHLLSNLRDFYNNNQRIDDNSFKSNWLRVKNLISKNITNNGYKVIYSDMPQAQFIVDLMSINIEQGKAAHEFMIGRTVNFNSRDDFVGYLKAYEFIFNKSIDKQRGDSNEKILNKLLNELREKTIEVNSQFKKTTTELEHWKNNFTGDLTKWKEDKQGELKDYLDEKRKGFTDLTKLYTEKIKLEGPATHWQNRVKKYRKQGIVWTSILTVTVAVLIYLFMKVLYDSPESFKSNIFGGDPSAIKAVIILAAIISFAVFLIRIFSKMIYSSFHLMRDSEEREQLTIVYLALVKEGKIDEEDRKLVFEALFSRADTGLLGGDSSPSMPGGLSNIIDKLGRR